MRLTHTSRRPATITVIVVAFLGLLFVLGLTFALYGIREADESKVFRDSHNGGQTGMRFNSRGSSTSEQPPEPEVIINDALGKVLYGSPDDLRGYFNHLRHQEIARTMYGFNPVDPTGATQAYSGVGALPADVVHPTMPPSLSNRVNWSWPGQGNLLFDSDNNYARDPITNAPAYNPLTYKYYARSANYTYPDRNNMFLGAVDPKSGRVMIPSYHRPYLIGGVQPPANNEAGAQNIIADPLNPWVNTEGRYLMLRPRPVDHQWPPGSGQSEWRYPEPDGQGGYGDVENLSGKSFGRQLDSMWMDLDLPVGRWMGKSFKPMVAFLIVDLDGRVNLNTAGNYVQQVAGAPIKAHGSNQGIGPWEVNPTHVLRDSTNTPDYYGGYQIVSGPIAPPRAGHNRFGYTNPIGPIPLKRVTSYYGESLFPNMPAPGSGAHFYSAVDFDGGGQQAQPYSMSIGHETAIVWAPPYVGTPFNAGDPPRPSGPPNPPSRYGSGIYIPGAYDERSHHPSMFNPYLLHARGAIDPNASVDLPNRVYGVQEVRHLNAQYNYGNYRSSELAQFAPSSLGQSALQYGQLNPRLATTVLSNDLHLPGASPWLNSPSNQYMLMGQAPIQPTGPPPSPLDLSSPSANLGLADFDSSYRAKIASIVSAIDVTRKLTDYRNNANQPYSPMNMGNVNRAVQDRYNLCKDIFDRLRFATCGQSPGYIPAAGTPEFNAHRFLAQLAVNIVDYIDNDDIMTVFPWNPSAAANPFGSAQDFTPPLHKQRVVFGFERPRLVMNETYVRYENDVADPKTQDPNDMNKPKARMAYQMKVWMELHNPLTPGSPAEQTANPQGDDGTNGGYRAKLVDTLPSVGETSIYRILISKVNRNPAPMDPNDPMLMRPLDNVDGTPDPMAAAPIRIVDFRSGNVTHPAAGQPKVVQPNVGALYGPNNASFYIIGPELDGPPMMAGQPAQLPGNEAPPIQANLTTSDLQWPMNSPAMLGGTGNEPNDIDVNTNRPTWVPGFTLQRLANPYASPSPTNPYVTTDYLNPDLTAVSIYDRVEASFSGNPNNMGVVPDLQLTYSWGRRQPYDAFINYADQNRFRQRTAAGGPGQIGGQTFGRHNGTQAAAYPAPGPNPNETLEQPFRPLVHLDRTLLSQAELMHVVAVKPHELTHLYQAPPVGQRWQYTANWLDQGIAAGSPGTYLWRALDYLKVPTRHAGLGMGGRVAGKVNINTIFAQEIFNAVCDAQAGTNRFTQAQVNQAWQTLSRQRTPGWMAEPPPPNPFSAQDRPFYGSAAAVSPQTPPNSSVMDQHRTILHTSVNPGQQGLWDGTPTSQEDYTANPSANAGAVQKFEMLNKVFNQFTTRSNCFAVYATIGYFEVRNPGPYNETNRPVLGKELGLDEGQVTRHKFFSVIDRTNLSIENPAAPNQPIRQGVAPVYLSYQPNVPLPTAANGFTVSPDPIPSGVPLQMNLRIPITGRDSLGRLMGYYDGTAWTIQSGVSLLEIGTGQNVESNLPITVMPPDPMNDPATATTTAVIQVMLTRQHNRGDQMRLMNPDPAQAASVPGNPGPQPGFNYKSQRYAPVVKYVEQLR